MNKTLIFSERMSYMLYALYMFNVVFYHKNTEVDATIIAIIDDNDILMRSRDCITIDLGVSFSYLGSYNDKQNIFYYK